MITYWQQIDSQFTKIKKEDIDSRKPVWVDARNITRDETVELKDEYDIEQDHLMDILDPDELSRIEEGEGYILTIVRVPVYDPQAETPYLAAHFARQTVKFLKILAITELKISDLQIFHPSLYR